MYQGRAANSPVRDVWRRGPERMDVRNAHVSSGALATTSTQSNRPNPDAPLGSYLQYHQRYLCIHHCQVFGRKITADSPIPCSFYKLNCCWPCWLETEVRELPESEQNSFRFDLLGNGFFRNPEPKEFDAFDNVYQDYFVHKIPISRYLLVKRNIEKRDYSDVTGEELMVHMWMYGGKVGDSLVRFAHPVNNGAVIQYHWKRLRTDKVTFRILRSAVDLIKRIPSVLRSQSRLDLVMNRILVNLAENQRPAFLKYNQFRYVFWYEHYIFKQANQFICKWRMEREDEKWEKTTQDEKVDVLISEVLAKSTSGFHLPDREFERHRRLILEEIYNAIVQNDLKPVLNPLQIRRLSGELGDTIMGIRTMFEHICAEKSTVGEILDNAGTILKGFYTGEWPRNFETIFLEKQFENILKTGVTLEEDNLRKIAFGPELPYETVLHAFEEFKAKWESVQAVDNVLEPDQSDGESDGTSDRPRPSIFARPCPSSPRYQGGRSQAEKWERQGRWYRDCDAYNAQLAKEGDSDIDLIEDSDGAVDERDEQDESRKQDVPREQRRDRAPCSYGEFLASYTSSLTKNLANKRPDTPTTSVIHKIKKPRLEEGSPPPQSLRKEREDTNTPDDEPEYDADGESDEDESGQHWEDEEVLMDTDQQHQEEDYRGHTNPEHDADSESSGDEPDVAAQIQRIGVPDDVPVQLVEDEELPKVIGQQHQEDGRPEHDNPEHNVDSESGEDEPVQRVEDEGIPREIGQKHQEDCRPGHRKPEHDSENGCHEVEPALPREDEGVPLEIDQEHQEENHPGRGNQEYDSDNESDEDEPGQYGDDEEVPMEIGQQHQEDDRPGHRKAEHESNTDEPEVAARIQPIGVIEAEHVQPVEDERILKEIDQQHREENHQGHDEDPEVMPAQTQGDNVLIGLDQPQADGNQNDDDQEDHEDDDNVPGGEPMMPLHIPDDDVPRGVAQPQPNEDFIADDRVDLQKNGRNPDPQEEEPEIPVQLPGDEVPVDEVQAQPEEDMANDEQNDLQGNDGNSDPQPQLPQLQAVVDQPRRANAGPQHAPVVNQTVLTSRPVPGRAVLPIPANQPRRVSVRIQEAARQRIQAANQLSNRVMPPRRSQPVPTVARPQRTRARNAQPRNGLYRSGQTLSQAQVNQFVAQNACEVRVAPLTQAQIDEALGNRRTTTRQRQNAQSAQPRIVRNQYRPGQILTQAEVDHFLAHNTYEIRVNMMSQAEIQAVLRNSRRGTQAPPCQPRNRSQRAQARDQRVSHPQALRRSERIRSLHAN